MADVEIDPDTGKVKILRYTCFQDVGRAVNPVQVEGQLQGGAVQGIGWAVLPEGEVNLPFGGVPYVKRELNWVRVAQRFPVRIEVENPDDSFRIGASAVVTITGPAPRQMAASSR